MKLNKEEKKLNKYRKTYEQIAEEFGLKDKEVVEQVKVCIDEAVKVNKLMREQTDKILEDYEKVSQITPIDKQTYLEFVRICSLKNNDSLKEKAINKFEQDFYDRLFTTNLRHSFLTSYMNGDQLKITDEDQEQYTPYADFQSEEFEKLMNESATKREYINLSLKRRYMDFWKASYYITNQELNKQDFKLLVEFEETKDGGVPKEDSPSKLWSIFNKFNKAYRLLNKYGKSEETMKMKEEFGLVIDETTPKEVDHPWLISKIEEE